MSYRIRDITEGKPDNETAWVRIPDTWSSVGSPWELVEGRFDKTAYFAETAFGYTTEYMGQISDFLKELEVYKVPDIEVDSPEISHLPIETRPHMSDLGLDTTEWPKNDAIKPDLETLPDIPYIEIPTSSVRPPSYTDIASPETVTPTEPARPVIGNIALPSEPSYIFPEPPTLDSLNLPAPPNITIPTFDASFIEIDIPTPATFNWNASPYNSDVWKTLLDQVITGMTSDRPAFTAEVEQMIFDRAKYRQLMSNDKAYREVEKYFSSRGYRMPPGAMAARLAEISVEILKADTDLNEQIAIEMARLTQSNKHFMIEAGRQAEGILRDFHSAQENRALEAAKTVVTTSIEVMNGYIQKQNAYVEIYKAEASVYGERIRGALGQVEIYKAEVEGVKVSAEVQKVQVDIYEAQISAVEIMARIYSIRMEGAKIFNEIEKTKIDIYKADTEVYAAKMAIEKLKVDIYTAQVEAEKTKAITYSEQIKGFIAEIEAKKTELGFHLAVLQGKAQKNDSELRRYQTELSAYQIEVDTKAKQIGAVVDAFGAEVEAYKAETSAQESYYSVKIKEIDVAISEAKFNLDKAVAEIDAATKGYIAIKELQLKGTEGIMSVSAQLAASSLSAVHASANYGYSGNEGYSHSFNYGASISENHSIPHDPPQ